MSTEENMIPIKPYLRDFKQYLDANSRCILSAKFGNGKSYFINNFMKDYSEEYLFIPIYPVNYQVMDNKDIFELIKRDILIRLLSSEEININEIELNTASLFYYFFTSNPEDKLLDILGIIPDINIYGVDIKISSVIKKLKKVKDKFDAYKEQFVSADKTSELYISKFDSIKGSIYEFDAISQLICDIIHEYKKQHPSKKVVLIIEDLDRIDPAHIFRILNVFSAHFDRHIPGIDEFEITCGNNKFCLDKIISVCDIDNIKNIYAHVYGEKTDFIGYISKFSNSKEYDYSLNEKMKEYIVNTLLDKSLLKYPQICNVLSGMIMSSMDKKESTEKNLRIIKERISKVTSFIRTKNIELDKRLSGKYITSNSDLMKLLALLRSFELKFNSIDINSNNKGEFVKIIGKYWVLAPSFEERIIFNPKESTIDIAFYRGSKTGIGDWIRCNSISNCIYGNEIVDFDLTYYWDMESTYASLTLDQMHKIVDYLNRQIII